MKLSSCTSLGLDISTKTGYAVTKYYGDDIELTDTGIITSRKKGFERWSEMAVELIDLLHAESPHVVVIEGYGFANKHTLATLVEVGTVLRYFLWQEGIEYKEIPPNTLKKFVTGKGNANKDMIIKEVYKRWGHDTNSNDIADAIGLAYIGMAINRIEVGLPKVNMSALKNFIQ